VAKRRIGLEFVQCKRIVDTSADSPSIEGLQDPITTGQSDNIQMMDTAFTVTRAIDLGNTVQRCVVIGSNSPPGRIPFIEPFQLYPEDSRLQSIEAAV